MSLNKVRKNRVGFTLVELLVVVLVIGVLLAIALPLYQGATRNAAGGTVKSNLRSMFTATQIVKAKTGSYPADVATINNEIGGSLDGKPANVAYTFSRTGTTNVISATETGDVFGTANTGQAITYTFSDGASTGTYAETVGTP